jgi:chromosome segregation ATPase
MTQTIPDDLGTRLHDRATRGEALSADEQGQLQQWYARYDQEEMARLAAAPASRDLVELQEAVGHASARLLSQAQRIQDLTAENAQLRREIASLQGQLATKLKAQPA